MAIDFTGSNGDPRKAGTLHHLDSASKNSYEKAISAIVGILSKYDSDKMFPVVGFGAKYDGTVRHCFQCGGTEEVHGVAGVLEAYHQTFKSGLIMSSPTVFTEVIESAAARALSSQEKAKQKGQQAYTILLIVTDGAVSDSQATAMSLQQVSDAPLSVVIVGVGDADFSFMEFLDNSSKPGQRDIAQFVQMNKHQTSSVQRHFSFMYATSFCLRALSTLVPLRHYCNGSSIATRRLVTAYQPLSAVRIVNRSRRAINLILFAIGLPKTTFRNRNFNPHF